MTLQPDPRVQLPAGALQDQLRLATKLVDLLSAASRALLTATSEQEQLKALAGTAAVANEQVEDILQAVQVMRQRAQAAGNLQNTPQETVSYDQGNI